MHDWCAKAKRGVTEPSDDPLDEPPVQLPAVTNRTAPGVLAPLADDQLIPALIADAGNVVSWRHVDFFTSNIRNPNTRRAYARACQTFFVWCDERSWLSRPSGPAGRSCCTRKAASTISCRAITHSPRRCALTPKPPELKRTAGVSCFAPPADTGVDPAVARCPGLRRRKQPAGPFIQTAANRGEPANRRTGRESRIH